MNDSIDRLTQALADRYRIERELGAGGMATVYLAEDLKHDRKVALKVLRPELAAVLGGDRFVVEIKTTAQLQHPHILPLFDSGAAGGFLFYVMPYVEGETLRDKLNRESQLGIDEAIKITTEVADALDYAHRHGVIHRDIKPENILLHDGRPMVADFGIALALSAAAGGRMTETGMSLGTPHYMSPEQATAEKTITNRSDVYSLAAVLYEMLAGEPPHMGNTAQAIIMKIVTDDARPLTELRKSVPPHVAAAVAKALQRLAADRFESAKAFAEALNNPTLTLSGTMMMGASIARGGRRSNALVAGLGGAAVISTALALWGWFRPAPPRPVTRFVTSLTSDPADASSLRADAAISPDGSEIVYRDTVGGVAQLFLKRRGDLEPQALAGTQGGRGPFFSPDGKWIAFLASGHLLKMPDGGGGTVTLADSAMPARPTSGTWLDDGTIVFTGTAFNLRRVSASGGASTIIYRATGVRPYAFLPRSLPGSRGILFTRCDNGCSSSGVYVYDARGDSARLLYDDAMEAWYAPMGYVLYLTRQGTLLAAPWDNDKLIPAGPAVPLLDGIQAPNFVLSASGTALYVLGPQFLGSGPIPNAEAVWVSRTGKVEPVEAGWRFNTGNGNWGLALSPDGRRLAIRLNTDQGEDVWIKQLSGGQLSRLTFYDGEDRAPWWSPDGKSVTFISERPVGNDTTSGTGRYNVWSRAADGTGEAKLLWRSQDFWTQGFWTPDGKWLVMRTGGLSGVRGGRDIYAVRPGTDSVARPLLATRYDEQGPAVSPDSKWLAYLSNETGVNAVFVRPFPDVDRGKWQISTGEASAPLWAHHGHELFYFAGDTMMSVTLHPGPPFSSDKPHPLFVRSRDLRPGQQVAGMMDITPDDQRFIMVQDVPVGASGTAPKLVLVQNFFAELKAKMAK